MGGLEAFYVPDWPARHGTFRTYVGDDFDAILLIWPARSRDFWGYVRGTCRLVDKAARSRFQHSTWGEYGGE